MKKIIFSFFIFLFSGGVLFAQDDAVVKEVQVLHWNDFHARNTSYSINKKDSAGNTYSVIIGGTANLLGYINKYRDGKTILLNGGDDFQGSPISTITKGRSQIELLNLYGLDAFVLGNHEFDYGENNLDSALMNANFDYLSANVWFTPQNKTFGKSYVIKEINGVKIGIIGLTALDLKTLVLPSGVDEIEMLNVDSVVSVNIHALKNQNCDLIFLLTHIGKENDQKLAEKFYGDLDVIVGGHSHTPLFKPVIQNGVIIVQAGSYGRWLGKLNLNVDITKDTILSYKGNLVETLLDSSIYNMHAAALVDDMLREIEPALKRVIGTLQSEWKQSYSSESNIGQWEADVVRAKTNSDIAVLNSGGIRKGLSQGNITVGDIWEINPFGNTITIFGVSGKTLKEMIRNNIKQRVIEIDQVGSSDMLVASGMEIVYDSKKVLNKEDDFIISITVNGENIDENKTYQLATNNYMAGQFKKYFGDVSQEIVITDTNIIDRDMFIEAVEEQNTINSVLEKRIIDVSNQDSN
ncbi:MAG TPA: bifunctional UDP-sugar hydrolase/5'-nucleotidase [Ignavibacteria bacterium]|nr:bifunctional UDP-sugar hydrolase/5'-nucleotidase [Ignavibacteria bacterium]